MKLNTLLFTYAVVSGSGGVLALVLPQGVLRLYGITAPEPLEMLLLRLVGACALAIAVMAWFARDVLVSRDTRGLVLGLILLNGLSSALGVAAIRLGVLNEFAWITAGLDALFAIMFAVSGRNLLTRSQDSARPRPNEELKPTATPSSLVE